ncbi:MAG: DUF1905 domain-containing protein [Chitinophagaceae bacterium]|nr:DUF1905 domain-containing protein [Chitinophagaceae bacterium]
MKHKGIKYEFSGQPWKYQGAAAWHFISLPAELATEIRTNLQSEEEGWGRLKVIAKIGRTEWATAIWFDTKLKTYLLPLKAEVRKVEQIEIGKLTGVTIWV